MSSLPPRPPTLDELLAEVRSGFERPRRRYPTELPERLRPPKPPAIPGTQPRGFWDEALERVRGTVDVSKPNVFGTRYEPEPTPEPTPDTGKIQADFEDQVRVGARHVAAQGGDAEEYVHRMHRLHYGPEIAERLKAGRDHARKRVDEGMPVDLAESEGVELARRHIENLDNLVASGELAATARGREDVYRGLVEGLTTRRGLARHALTTGLPVAAGAVATGPLGLTAVLAAPFVAGAGVVGDAAAQKYVDEKQNVDWESATVAGITNTLPVPVIESVTRGGVAGIANPLLRRAAGTLAVAAAEAVEEPVQAVAQSFVQGQGIPSGTALAAEAIGGGIIGGALGGGMALVEQARQEASDTVASATELETAPPTRDVGRIAADATDAQLAEIEAALGEARFAGDLPAIQSLEAARQEILDARAKGSEEAVPASPPTPGRAGPAPPPSAPPAAPPPGTPPQPPAAPPGPVSDVTIRPQTPQEPAAPGAETPAEAAAARQEGMAPGVRALTEAGQAEAAGQAAPPTPPVVRGPTGGTARGVETTPAIPPAAPGVPPAAPAPGPAAVSPSAPAAAPPAAPVAPEPPPERRLRIGRGAHGQVEVIFPNQVHADLFSALGRSRRGRDPGRSMLAHWLNIPPDLVMHAAIRYRDAVMEAIRGLPEGARFVAPTFADVVRPTDEEVAPEPPPPEAVAAMPEIAPEEAGLEGEEVPAPAAAPLPPAVTPATETAGPPEPAVEPTTPAPAPAPQEEGALPGFVTPEGQVRAERAERRERRATELSPEEARTVAAAPGEVPWPTAESLEIAKEWYDAGKVGPALALYRAVAAAHSIGAPIHEGWYDVFPDIREMERTGRRPRHERGEAPEETEPAAPTTEPAAPAAPIGVTEPGAVVEVRHRRTEAKPGSPSRLVVEALDAQGNVVTQQIVASLDEVERLTNTWLREHGLMERPQTEPQRITVADFAEPYRKAIDKALERLPPEHAAKIRPVLDEQAWRERLIQLREDDYAYFGREFDPIGQKIKNRANKRRAAKQALDSARALYEAGWETVRGIAVSDQPAGQQLTERMAALRRLRQVFEGKGVRLPQAAPERPPIPHGVLANLRGFLEHNQNLERLPTEAEAIELVKEYAQAYPVAAEDVLNDLARFASQVGSMSPSWLKGYIDLPGVGPARIQQALAAGPGDAVFDRIVAYRQDSAAHERALDELIADVSDRPFVHPALQQIADNLAEDRASGLLAEGENGLDKTFMWGVIDPATGEQATEEAALAAIRAGQGRLFARIRTAYRDAMGGVEDEAGAMPTDDVPFDIPTGGVDEESIVEETPEDEPTFVSGPQDPFAGRYGPPPKRLTQEQAAARDRWLEKLKGVERGKQVSAQRPAAPAGAVAGEAAPAAQPAPARGEGAPEREGAPGSGSRGGPGSRGAAPGPGAEGQPRAAAPEPGPAAGEVQPAPQKKAGLFQIVNPRERETFVRPPKYSLIPPRLHAHLSPEQKVGVAKAIEALEAGSGFLFADGTGVGKTREILATAYKFAQQGLKVLIIAPSGAIAPVKEGNIERPSGSYADDSAAMGIPIEFTRKRKVPLKAGAITMGTYHAMRDYAVDKDTVVVFDEAHLIKNIGDSERASEGVDLINRARVALFATATPGDKGYHLGYLASIGILEGKPLEQAMKDLGLKAVEGRRVSQKIKAARLREIQKKQPGLSPKEADQLATEQATEKYWKWKVVSTRKHHKALDALFARLTERGTVVKREVDLSPVSVDTIVVPLSDEGRAIMDRIERAGFERKLALMHMRRQQEPFKLDKIKELVIRALGDGRQVVLFATRINKSDVIKRGKLPGGESYEQLIVSSEGTLRQIGEWLDNEGISYAEIHGDAKEQSSVAQERFQSGNAKVLIATYEKGGTGINLDDRSGAAPRTMILMTAPFEAASVVQAIGRVHRFTTRSPSKIQILYSDHDVDVWNARVMGAKLEQHHAQVSGDIAALDLANTAADEELLMSGVGQYMDVAAILGSHGQPGPGGTKIYSARHYGKIVHQLKEFGIKFTLKGGEFEIPTHEGFAIVGSLEKTPNETAYATFTWEHDEEAGDLRLAAATAPPVPRAQAKDLGAVVSELKQLIGQFEGRVKPIVSMKQHDFLKSRLDALGAKWGAAEKPGSFQVVTKQGNFFAGELVPPKREVFGRAPKGEEGAFWYEGLADPAEEISPKIAALGREGAERRLATVESAIDRAYKRGKTEAAENLEAEADELRTYLEGLEAEREPEPEGHNVEGTTGVEGGEGEGASIEEQLAVMYENLERLRAGLPSRYGDEEDVIGAMREVLGFPSNVNLREVQPGVAQRSDEEVEAAARDAWQAMRGRRERLAGGGSMNEAMERFLLRNQESVDPASEGSRPSGVVGLPLSKIGLTTYIMPELQWGAPVRLGTGQRIGRGGQLAGVAGTSVLGAKIREGFLRIGRIEYKGLHVKNLADMAALFHTARNPSLEHGMVVFIDSNGTIVHTMQATSQSPSYVSWGSGAAHVAEIADTIDRLASQGVTVKQIIDLHNHPSGDPTPSTPDRRRAALMSKLLGKRYGGSAVIDHHRAVLILPSGQLVSIRRHASTVVDPDPYLTEGVDAARFHDPKNPGLRGPEAFRTLMQGIVDQGWWNPASTDVSVAFLDARRRTRVVTLVPESLFTDRNLWRAFTRIAGRVAGAQLVYAATDGGFARNPLVQSAAIQHMRDGTLQEMVDLRSRYNPKLEAGATPREYNWFDRGARAFKSHERLEERVREVAAIEEPPPSAYPPWNQKAPTWWEQRVKYARARSQARARGTTAAAGVDPASFWDAFVLGVEAIRRGTRRFAEWLGVVGRDVRGFDGWGRRVWDYIRTLNAPVIVDRRGTPAPFGEAVAGVEPILYRGPIRPIPRVTPNDLAKSVEALLRGEAGEPVDVGAGKPLGIGVPKDLAVNINNVVDEAGIRELMARIVRALEPRFNLARLRFTNAELKELALKLGYDEADYLRMVRQKGALTAPEIIAGRVLRQHAGIEFSNKWATFLEAQQRAAEPNLSEVERNKRRLEALDANREQLAALQKMIAMMFGTAAAGSEAGRALYAHKLLISQLTPTEIALQQLARAGRADQAQLAALAEALKKGDQAAVARLLRKIHKPGFIRMLVEYFINSLLSAPTTHIANVTGNLIHEAALRTPERAIAARLEQLGIRQGIERLLTGKAQPSERVVGEAMEAIRAQVRHKFGILAALDLSRQALTREDQHFLQGVKGDAYLPAIPGLFGKIVRTPGRVMEALDLGAKISAEAAEKAAQIWRKAYVEAGGQGIGSPEFRARVAELHALTDQWIALERQRTSDPGLFQEHHGAEGYKFLYRHRDLGEIHKAMLHAAEVSTFRDETTRFTSFVKQVRGAYPWLSFIVPFVHTTERILVQGFRRTPLGLLKTAYNIQQGRLSGGEASDRLAQGVLGSLVTGALYMLAADGLVTGGGPEEPREREQWLKTGKLPYAIKIGDTWVSYARLEPFATIFGFAADLAEAKDEKTAGDAFGKLHYAVLNNITNKTYLEGLVSAAEAVGDPDRYMSRYWKRTLGAFVPNLLASAARAIDPTMRETDDFSQVLMARVPILSETLPPRLTGTGEIAERPENALTRFVSPVRYSEEAGPEKNLERLFLETGYSPSQPPRDITLPGTMGRKVALTRAEREIYGAYSRRASAFARSLATNRDWKGLDVYAKEELLKRIFRHAHDVARRDMLASVLNRLRRGEAAIQERR